MCRFLFRLLSAVLVVQIIATQGALASEPDSFFFHSMTQAPGILLSVSTALNAQDGPQGKGAEVPELSATKHSAQQLRGGRPRVSIMAAIGASMPSLANSRGFISVAKTIFGQAEDAPVIDARVAEKPPLQEADCLTVLGSREVDFGTSLAIGHPGKFELTVANRTRMFANSFTQIRQSKGVENVAIILVGF